MRVKDMQRDSDGKLPAFAWPGGYPIAYYTKDGLTICADCASREVDQSQEVTDADVYYEGPDILCEDCQKNVIESAYGEPDAEE